MNKKLAFIAIPIALLPYLALFSLATIFFSADVPVFHGIMEHIFQNNALYLIAALLIFALITAALTCICSFISIYRSWDAFAVAKTAMIIKLVQAPAYLLTAVLSALFIFALFTIPFAFGLFAIAGLSLFMTGILVISSVVISIKTKEFPLKDVFWVVLLQFVIFGDVIASVCLYRKLKAIYEHERSVSGCIEPVSE